MTSLETLKVDTESLSAAGGRLLDAATNLPDAPSAFNPAYGSDALSAVLQADVPTAEAPIIQGLPPLKQSATGTAKAIVEAAERYAAADSQLKGEYDRHQFDTAGGGASGGGSAGGGMSGAVGGAIGSGSSAAGAAASPAEQLGQLMGMPMQMAQQAAQVPMQMAGMASSVPQGVMQGVQGAVQQVGQLSGGLGSFGSQADGSKELTGKLDEQPRDEVPAEGGKRAATDRDGAAAGTPHAERVPESAPSRPEMRPPSPSRPSTIDL